MSVAAHLGIKLGATVKRQDWRLGRGGRLVLRINRITLSGGDRGWFGLLWPIGVEDQEKPARKRCHEERHPTSWAA